MANDVRHIFISAPESYFKSEEGIEKLQEQGTGISLYFASHGIRSHTYCPQIDNRKLFRKNRRMLRNMCDQVIRSSDVVYVPYWECHKWQKDDLRLAKDLGVKIICNSDLMNTLRDYKAEGVKNVSKSSTSPV